MENSNSVFTTVCNPSASEIIKRLESLGVPAELLKDNTTKDTVQEKDN